ncbi:hypothetical protein AOZ06_46170 [Kibdelosporangium phytohabitans]|uniref:DUF3558 domain-containing protein n=1 Tax=Kibdelosporangium phytohabitans TaxID=860235 RepID=A0A0N9IDU9_9PSEU|nr:hypothetical protein AOZ06_46170 [Kibdelosporangium phytohabitans]
MVLAVAGCAGPTDQGKSVSNRRTVKATGSFTLDGLRTVDPCALYTDELISSIGKKPSDLPDRNGYSECRHDVSEFRLAIKLGDDLIGAPKQTSKTLAGLGVYETRTSTSCLQTAIVTRDPELGIIAQAGADSADPCPAATKVLESVVKQIAEGKAKYPETKGSLVGLDPCAAMEDKDITQVLGDGAKKQPSDIRYCRFVTKSAYIAVQYSMGRDPATTTKSNNPTKFALPDKKDAYVYKPEVAPNKCQVEWAHRALEANFTENVSVAFEPVDPTPGIDPCTFAKGAAGYVSAKLAKA